MKRSIRFIRCYRETSKKVVKFFLLNSPGQSDSSLFNLEQAMCPPNLEGRKLILTKIRPANVNNLVTKQGVHWCYGLMSAEYLAFRPIETTSSRTRILNLGYTPVERFEIGRSWNESEIAGLLLGCSSINQELQCTVMTIASIESDQSDSVNAGRYMVNYLCLYKQ